MTEPAEVSHAVLVRVAEFLRRLPQDRLAELAAGTVRLDLVPRISRGSASPVIPAQLPRPAEEIGAALGAAADRSAATAYLDDLRLTVPQLRGLARGLGVAVPSRANRAQARDTIVAWTIDRRVTYR